MFANMRLHLATGAPRRSCFLAHSPSTVANIYCYHLVPRRIVEECCAVDGQCVPRHAAPSSLRPRPLRMLHTRHTSSSLMLALASSARLYTHVCSRAMRVRIQCILYEGIDRPNV